MAVFFYTLGTALILSCILDLRVKDSGKCLAFGLVRILLALPLLAGIHYYFSLDMPLHLIAPLLFLENGFAFIWILSAFSLQPGLEPALPQSYLYRLLTLFGGGLVLGSCVYDVVNPPTIEIVDDFLTLPRFGRVYISSLFMLVAAFFMAWRLEIYWRPLNPQERRRLKYLVIGFFLVSGSLFWCASYRIAYMRLVGDHFLLSSILLLLAWLLISYAVFRYRLLNRSVYVSRRVTYSAVAPTIFAGYLILLGTASLMMRAFGWPLHFVLQWLLVILGILVIIVLALSGEIRRSVKYFISTHFYVNKYEYRNEWLAFSDMLRGAWTETEVVEALRRILKESLYTDTVMIWLADGMSKFRLAEEGTGAGRSFNSAIASDDMLTRYLEHGSFLDTGSLDKDPVQRGVIERKKDFFDANGLVLMMPLVISRRLVGLVGLGPEYSGARYGRDDYDLLTALCIQAASALLAVRMAENLAHAREKSAWRTFSAFVLHDIKNAVTMLNLVKENAPAHIHKPEFQQDLLHLVDDALKRMNKVQTRLKTLQGETKPDIKAVEIKRLLSDCCRNLTRKLRDLQVVLLDCREMIIDTDPVFVEQILENLLINALEAGGPGISVRIGMAVGLEHTLDIEITDNGPGIHPDLLPDRLFDPFKTGKEGGSGIGLWQVKKLVENLGGTIEAGNMEGGGAKFVIRLHTAETPTD